MRETKRARDIYQSIKASTRILFDCDCEISAAAAVEGIEVGSSPSSGDDGERGRLSDSGPEWCESASAEGVRRLGGDVKLAIGGSDKPGEWERPGAETGAK